MVTIVTSSRYKVSKKLITQHVADVFRKHAILPERDLNIVFVGKRKMLAIATQYKKEPEALPVLSFGYDSENNLLGEIFICYPQAVLLAAERNKKVDDILRWLIEHGIENLVKEE